MHAPLQKIIPETGRREGSYTVHGKVKRISNTTLLISELPVGKWTQEYKEVLEKMMAVADADDKKKKTKKKGEEEDGEGKAAQSEIMNFTENHTDTTVLFKVTAKKENIDAWEGEKGGLHAKFKLSSTLSTKNYTAFDKDGKIRQYKSSLEILQEFFRQRMIYYIARKDLVNAGFAYGHNDLVFFLFTHSSSALTCIFSSLIR